MTYFEACKRIRGLLEEAGVPEPDLDARYLVEFVGGFSEAGYLLDRDKQIPGDQLEKLEELASRRCGREPLQYILGSQEFMGLPFICNKDCLIPRQDTEILVERAMAAVADLRKERTALRYLDLCTGSGCVAISLTKLAGIGEAEATDISEAALSVARRNAELNKTDLKIYCSDLFEKVKGKFNIITANPPYIDTGLINTLIPEIWKYEPMTALDGGDDGLSFYRRITAKAREYLEAGGYLLFETGDTQGEAVSQLMRSAGFENVGIHKDLAGLDRVVEGKLP